MYERFFRKEVVKSKTKEELKSEMHEIKTQIEECETQEKALDEEIQQLKGQRHEAWVEYKNNYEIVSCNYFRITPELDLFYTTRELIALLDSETDSEREAEKMTDNLIESMSTFSQSCFDSDKLKTYKQTMDPLLNEIQTKLINQRANNDTKLAGTNFCELLITFSDSLYHIINGGNVEDLKNMFPVNPEEEDTQPTGNKEKSSEEEPPSKPGKETKDKTSEEEAPSTPNQKVKISKKKTTKKGKKDENSEGEPKTDDEKSKDSKKEDNSDDKPKTEDDKSDDKPKTNDENSEEGKKKDKDKGKKDKDKGKKDKDKNKKKKDKELSSHKQKSKSTLKKKKDDSEEKSDE